MTKWIPTLQAGAPSKYLAIADAIESAVESGQLMPGQQLPTHRDLADDLGVTVGTVTRAYAEARKRGIISGTVGRGTFVSMDVRIETSMMPVEKKKTSIEMGLITPLYAFDPDMHEELVRLSHTKDIQRTFRYSDPVGRIQDRLAATIWLKEYGMDVHEDDVIISAGAQHGLNCILAGLFAGGDRVAVEHLTYPGFKTLAAMLGISLVSIEMDDQGMMPEALDTACRREKIRGIFVMPGQQNPTTGRMSKKRRGDLVEVARRHSLTIIEDCAYDISTETAEPPLALLAPERTILIAGVSKYFGAGLRTAYLVADREFHNRLRQAVLNTIWMASPLTVRLTSMLIESGTAQTALADKLAEAKKRNRAARQILYGMQYRMRPDGFFIWLSLPEPWTGPQLELAAAERRVSVFCADKFVVGEGPVPNGVRISLTGPDTLEDLVFGLKTIREIVSAPPSLSALL